MIDWIKVKIELLHEPLFSGSFITIDNNGEVEREIHRPTRICGSYSSSLSVRSVGSVGEYVEGVASHGRSSHLEITGNPAKFLQGHNVVGSDDLLALVNGVALSVINTLGISATSAEIEKIKKGQYYVNWIDINYSYELGCQADVEAWIKSAEFSARSRSGRPNLTGGTLYIQKNSRRWAIKFYSKGAELAAGKQHALPIALEKTGLLEYSKKLLRCELRLLGKELRDLNIQYGYQLTPERIRKLYEVYMAKISVTGQMRIQDEKAQALPSRVLPTYTMWLDGHNVVDLLSKSKFYRDRKELLSYDIDISLCRPSGKPSNVVSLIRVLEAKPATLPEWLHKKGLIYSGLRSVN